MNILSFCGLILWSMCNIAVSGDNIQIFCDISPGMKWDEVKETVEILQPESKKNTLNFGHSFVLGSSWHTSYEIQLPNDIFAYVVLDSEFLSSDENAKILYIFTKDHKFGYNGIKIGMSLDKVKEFLVEPSICFQDGAKSIVDINGLILNLGKWDSRDPKLVWKSEKVQSIGHLSKHLVKDKFDWKKHYIDKEYDQWLKEK